MHSYVRELEPVPAQNTVPAWLVAPAVQVAEGEALMSFAEFEAPLTASIDDVLDTIPRVWSVTEREETMCLWAAFLAGMLGAHVPSEEKLCELVRRIVAERGARR